VNTAHIAVLILSECHIKHSFATDRSVAVLTMLYP